MFPGLLQCTTQNCKVISEKKENIIRHIKHSYVIAQKKPSAENSKIYKHCGARFVKKSNRDSHIAKIHRDEPLALLMSIHDADEGEISEEVENTSNPEQIIAETDNAVENNCNISNVNENEVVFDVSIDEQQVVFDISADQK